MPKVEIYDIAGQKTGNTIELNDNVFGVEMNEAVVHQAVVMQRAAQRLGTASTKTRSFVRGGGRKPWRQKGTGRARAGSIRSPLFIGGSTVFGPHPRSYAKAMPKKARRLAIRCALSARVAAGELIVVEGLDFETPKTKQVTTLIGGVGVEKALLITDGKKVNVELSARNIPGVKALSNDFLNVYDILRYDRIVLSSDAIQKIEEVLA